MAGHLLVDYFKEITPHSVFYTTRDGRDSHGLIVDAREAADVEAAVRLVRPQIIINAVGVLNQFAEQDPVAAYEVNGILPHRLATLADKYGARLVHISTDCVFLGDRGAYSETDLPDGVSSYARTKALGEVKEKGHLTIRTSIIGPEIREGGIGLLEWFLAQKGDISGYRKVFWNGVTTLELAKQIEKVMDTHLSGLIHLAHPQIVSKYELLQVFRETWQKDDVTILPTDDVALDRTLVSTREDVDLPLPDYKAMLQELAIWMKSHG